MAKTAKPDSRESGPVTPVLFRADHTRRNGGGERIEITAVFPTLPGIVGDPDSMTCYAHIGQHGTCSVGWYLQKTRAAKPEEYAALKSELESAPFGYRLKVYRRMTRGHRAALNAELRRLDSRVA